MARSERPLSRTRRRVRLVQRPQHAVKHPTCVPGWGDGKAVPKALEAKGHSQESSPEPGPPGGSVRPAAAAGGRAPMGEAGSRGKCFPLSAPPFRPGGGLLMPFLGPPQESWLPFLKDPSPPAASLPTGGFSVGRFPREPPPLWLPGLPFSQLCSTSGKPGKNNRGSHKCYRLCAQSCSAR